MHRCNELTGLYDTVCVALLKIDDIVGPGMKVQD